MFNRFAALCLSQNPNDVAGFNLSAKIIVGKSVSIALNPITDIAPAWVRAHRCQVHIACNQIWPTRTPKFGRFCKRQLCGNRPRSALLIGGKGHQQASLLYYLYVSEARSQETGVSFHRRRESSTKLANVSRDIAKASTTFMEAVKTKHCVN